VGGSKDSSPGGELFVPRENPSKVMPLSKGKDAFSRESVEDHVAKFEGLTPQQRKALNESQNCKDFILPLFEALGWAVYSDEVATEENIGGKRADYTFRLNGVAKFFLEAKKPGVDLRQADFAEQAISYAWHKSVPWAILTNFETLKVFSAEWDEIDPERSLVFELKCSEYATSEKLAWLSRKSIEDGELDAWAEGEFKKPKRENVDIQLAKDLLRWRNVLFENLKLWNSDKKIGDRQIAKGVQTLLDRLIFMRTTEDRKFENEHLRELLRSNEERKTNIEAGIKTLFRDYDEWYDSRLFEKQLCDELEYEDGFLKTVIAELYKNAKGMRYDFAKINADVLGSIYEQYLGQIQQGDARHSKRKQQGIYYTPRYVVDFIVRNTIGELIKDKPAAEIARIKVLDPACGSGSFLTRAFEIINQSLRKQSADDPGTQLKVTPKCVYGVDLDDEAVEIAQLNLLLRMVYQRERLPNLTHNIECGNSLLSGTPAELKKKFGAEWESKKPFNWQERFSEVFGEGFDAIVGNPPYIKEYVDKSAFDGLHDNSYYQGKMDLWTLFACQAIDHLKDGGHFSFIAPNSWLTNAGASIFRDKILHEGEIVSFIDFGDFKVFKDAGIQTMIFTFQKKKPRPSYTLQYSKVLDSEVAEDKIAAFLNSNLSIVPEGVEHFGIEFESQKYFGKTLSFLGSDNGTVIDQIERIGDFKLEEKEIAQGIVPNPDVVNSRNIKDISDDVIRNSGIKIGEGVFVIGKGKLSVKNEENNFIKPLYDTEEIGRYFFNPSNSKEIIYIPRGVKLSTDSKILDHLQKFRPIMEKRRENLSGQISFFNLHWPRDKRFFEKGSKIISVRKCSVPSFSYTENEAYVMLTFNVIETDRINLKYLTAILNSKVAYFWFKNRGKVQGDNLQIDKEPLMSFHIKTTADKKAEQRIIALVDRVMELNAELHQLDAILERETCAEIEDKAVAIEDRIDMEINNIYGLSSEQAGIIGC
jgi:adenine-specific DNA-methyltransferase